MTLQPQPVLTMVTQKKMSFYADLDNAIFDGDDDVNIRRLNCKNSSNEAVFQDHF